MAISLDTVKYVANLARIELNAEELNRLSGQLNEIVNFIDKLKSLNTQGTTATSHILSINTVVRDDCLAKSLLNAQAIANAPQKEENFFRVPRVIE